MRFSLGAIVSLSTSVAFKVLHLQIVTFAAQVFRSVHFFPRVSAVEFLTSASFMATKRVF